MHIFRNLITVSILLASFGVLQSKPLARAFEPFPENDPHVQNLMHITKVLDKALVPELSAIDFNSLDVETIDTVHLEQTIMSALPTIKAKVAHAGKHEFNQEQREVAIDLLKALNNLTATTTDDLMTIAQGRYTYELHEAQEKAIEKYCPAEVTQAIDSAQTQEERAAACKAFEQVDLHNPAFNLTTKFMCKYGHLEDIFLIADRDAPKTSLKELFYVLAKTIAFPFVVVNDFYFVPGWEEQFKKTGDLFKIMHTVTSQLLEALAEQS